MQTQNQISKILRLILLISVFDRDNIFVQIGRAPERNTSVHHSLNLSFDNLKEINATKTSQIQNAGMLIQLLSVNTK